MMVGDIGCASIEDDHIGAILTCVIHEWLLTRAEVIKEVQHCRSFRDEVVVIDVIVMKGKRNIISTSQQKRALDQLHVNHISVEKLRILPHELIYYINIYMDTEDAIKFTLHVLIFR